jgi:hypothetical protein
MTPNPLMRVRHVRWRLLKMLDEISALGTGADATAHELHALRVELGQARAELGRARDQAMAAHSTVEQQGRELRSTRQAQDELRVTLDATRAELNAQGRVLELLYEEDTQNLRGLQALRRSADYRRAFADPQPLVSVIIPTYLQTEALMAKAIPSALTQTYANLEVVVVGDGAPEETARAIAELGDERVRYENLTVRAPYPEDQSEFWRVAGTPPWNAAWELASGSWIAPLNDDDSFRPDHIEMLLSAARSGRFEVAYGAIEHHHPDGSSRVENSWPPESHHFGWQAAVIHAGLGFMPMQLGSGALGVPGDWSLCRRMRRAGVRFVKLDDVVVDYYPSGLWAPS